MGAGLLLASAAAGCVSRCVVHPLDTVRSRLMVSAGHGTLLSTLREVVAADGMRGLYRGFGVSVLLQAPAVATYLSTYEVSRDYFAQYVHTPILTHLSAGLVAESVSAVFWTPMEVVKQRAQIRALSASSVSVLRDLLRHEGARALFSGYAITVGVFGPYSMVYFAAYERFKAAALSRGKKLSTPVVSTSAAAAGALAAAVTTPLDVIKTRLQTQGDIAKAKGVSHVRMPYTSAWNAAKVIARQEGFGAFLKGITARVLWIMPGTAITMSTFEFLKRYVVNDGVPAPE